MSVVLELPWPPSVNHYWRHVGAKVLISREGRAYRQVVGGIVLAERVAKLEGRLAVRVMAYPPDKRRRDLDNLLKALLDALEHAGVYDDDGQIDQLTIERGHTHKGGKVCMDLVENDAAAVTGNRRGKS